MTSPVTKNRAAWYQQRRLLLAFPISCLVGSLALFSWLQVKNTIAGNSVKQTQQVRLAANRLLLDLINAETQFRGYTLTRRQEVASHFDKFISEIPVSMATLENLVRGNRQQSERLQRVKHKVELRTANLQENFRLIDSLPPDAIQQPALITRLLEGNQLTEQVRLELGAFLEEADRLQVERDRILQTQRQLTWIFLVFAALIGVGGSLLVWFILQRMENRLQQSTARLHTLNRFLQTISECNQTLVRATDECSLLQDISQILVDVGGYRGAWVGFITIDADQSITPMAQAGLDAEFLEALQMTWADTERGRSVTGTAIQTGKIQITQDITHDSTNDPWQELFYQYSIATAIALPLFLNDHCIGALTIFADTPHAFNSEQVKLLNEMAADLSFGIATLRTRAERQQAQEEVIRLNQALEKRVKESETRYQQIVELAEAGIWVLDRTGHTTYVNQSITRLLGYTESELLGRPMIEFMIDPGKQWEDFLTSISLHTKQIIKGEVRLRTKAGQELWTFFSTSPVFDENGQLLWTAALFNDISERKKAEEQLRLSSDRISLANAELARATRLKDEFLAGMSHELRTPLNAVLGLSEALLEEVYGSLTQKQKQSIQTISQSGQHLLELINDILDLAKIESGKMDLQLTTFSVRTLCETSLNFVRPMAYRKNIQLSLDVADEPGDILMDERRLRQVLINLLSNAVKFTPDGGRVELRAQNNVEDETVQLSVTDTGIGIALEDVNKLFQPFVQLDSSLSRRYEGTGLGLALVRRIVEMHGGSVILDSTPGQGSCFQVILPCRYGASPSLPAFKELPLLPLLTVKRALIIEDSEAAASQIARYLTELGVEATIYTQGMGALEVTLHHQPDIILLDVLLPDASGWEVLTNLKANQATQAIPVIVVSVVDERSQAFELGAADYLLKPINRQRLHQCLSHLFAFTPDLGSPPAIEPTNHENLPDDSQPHILLAEDNETNILTMMDYLQSYGVKVTLARNGLEAVEMTQQQTPDVILMDIQMPIMDGFEATRQIRSNPALAHIPIIALTALAMPGDRDRCFAAGAAAYLTKPVSLKQLMKTIAAYLPTLNVKG